MRMIIGTVLATSLLAAPVWGASKGELAEKARHDAVTHYRSTTWLVGGAVAGCLGSVLGGSIAMGAAAASSPNPPPGALSDVSDEDMKYYAACYRSAIQDMQMRDVTLGVVAGMAIYTGLFAIMLLTVGEGQ